ncbi:MAG: Gfo/Idh/MocA family oxidoreductase [Betaproteobacteria bacterium]|nr:MAG: Gfo/Idh/MocA family oxidoreductase [Betaproteobacteria bacterium]
MPPRHRCGGFLEHLSSETFMSSFNRRIGIIGTGFGAQVHAPGFRSEGWEVAAFCSRSREKAEKAAHAAGVEGVHTDPLELIRRDDLAAVAITTPPGSHHPLCVAALKAGKHVLCEKPFAIDAKQAAEMRDLADKTGRTAMINHEFRHTPQRAYIKDLLSDGYIGKFQLCTVELFLDRYVSGQPRPLTWMASKSQGGGVLGALGSHYIDGLRHWFGEVASVSGQLATLRPDLVDTVTGLTAQSQ